MLLVLTEDILLEMFGKIIGQISAEIIEGSGINGHSLNIFALTLHVDFLYPAKRFHGFLDNLEDASNIGNLLDEGT